MSTLSLEGILIFSISFTIVDLLLGSIVNFKKGKFYLKGFGRSGAIKGFYGFLIMLIIAYLSGLLSNFIEPIITNYIKLPPGINALVLAILLIIFLFLIWKNNKEK